MVVHALLSHRLSTTVSLETRTDHFLSGCPLLKLHRRLVVEGGKDVGRTRAIRVGWQSRGSLSTRVVFETRTATGREHFTCQDSGVSQIFVLIISNGEKILSNVNVVV